MANREARMWQHIHEDRALRQERKPQRKQQRSGPVRRKDWAELYVADPESYDELDVAACERVMPAGEKEARRAAEPPSALHGGLGELRADEDGRTDAACRPEGETETGTVIEVSTGLCRVALARGVWLCSLRPALRTPHSGFSNVVAAGDVVQISHNGEGRGRVEAVLPRRSALARPDVYYGHLLQVIVANVDQVLIVASWREPAFWPELVDRYLIASLRHNLRPVICLNKVDLADSPAGPEGVLATYRSAGWQAMPTSATSGLGIDALRGILQGRTTALAGLSGVGKSSLLAAAEPGLHLRTGDVNSRKHEGRHTTTQVTLHPLADGGFVVDTPGIREFGLSGLRKADLRSFYPEFSGHADQCAYANCLHAQEPGCAVRRAVHQGRVPAMRYDSYRKILRDLPA